MLGWFFVGMKSNIKELPDIILKASQLGFTSLYVAPLNPPVQGQRASYFEYYEKENLISKENDRELLEEMLSRANKNSPKVGMNFSSGYSI